MAKAYYAASLRPPAQLTLINQNLNDPDLGIFETQALTARSWPQIDNVLVENAFSSMIESVLSGRSPSQALREASERLSDEMDKLRRR